MRADASTRGAALVGRLAALARQQAGVFSTFQSASWGVDADELRSQVAAGRIRRLSEGVYFCANAAPGAAARMWAALLAAGEGAVLSHWTAAFIWGLLPRRVRGDLIEVSIPDERQEVSVPGVRIRRSRLLPGKATIHRGWPITTAADTVLDLVAEMRSPHDVVALLTDACRTRSVSATQILDALDRRKRQRHRQLIKDVLADVVGGVESNLEHKYLVRVERAHG
ncbi:MAG TPA: type IV toxin-antitoxin system AbiEi family antitoxin domain-containing protein, partial [Actinomycetes bacterium]|nr:type IV toxin-antitoxin system AbiEi family antitoxin domain-containing protein [Actinomycetes bacterium]